MSATNQPREPQQAGGAATGASATTTTTTAGGQQRSTLAAIHYESLQLGAGEEFAGTVSTLWHQLKKRFPELRNAAQYYTTEAQRHGTALWQTAATTVAAGSEKISLGGAAAGGVTPSVPQSESTAGADRMTPPPAPTGATAAADGAAGLESFNLETDEVHYQPNPLGQLGVQVHSVHIEPLPSTNGGGSTTSSAGGSGGTNHLLAMCIETGFALFEVTEQGVFELAVDLELSSIPPPPSPGAAAQDESKSTGTVASKERERYTGNVVAVRPLSSEVVLLVTNSSNPSSPTSVDTSLSPLLVAYSLNTDSTSTTSSSSSSAAPSSFPTRYSRPAVLPCIPNGLHMMKGSAPQHTSSPCTGRYTTSKTHAVVTSMEFAQFFIYEISVDVGDRSCSFSSSGATTTTTTSSGGHSEETIGFVGIPLRSIRFVEVASFCGDTTVCAASSRWLAFSGQSNNTSGGLRLPSAAEGEGEGEKKKRAAAPITELQATKAESTAESVTKNVLSGISSLKTQLGAWGVSPNLQPCSVPLGTVVVFDVQLKRDISEFTAHNHSIQCLRWDPTGTLLATASAAGTSINVYQVTPKFIRRSKVVAGEKQKESAGNGSSDEDDGRNVEGGGGEEEEEEEELTIGGTSVILLYRLCRGMTQCTVTDISFGPMNTWISVCTAVGTCHYFPVSAEERKQQGRLARQRPASTLGAMYRARSAWSSTAVNPKMCFRSSVVFAAGGAVRGVYATLVSSNSGTVTTMYVSEDEGASLVYSSSIDGFRSAAERPHRHPPPASFRGGAVRKKQRSTGTTQSPQPQHQDPAVGLRKEEEEEGFTPPFVPSVPSYSPAELEESDAIWRSAIELQTHFEGYGEVTFGDDHRRLEQERTSDAPQGVNFHVQVQQQHQQQLRSEDDDSRSTGNVPTAPSSRIAGRRQKPPTSGGSARPHGHDSSDEWDMS